MTGANPKLQGLKVLVIDDENESHGYHLPMWVSIALKSSSFVNGLVR